MSTSDQAENKVEQVKGEIKENVGEAIGSEHLQAEGETDQAKSHLKQAGEKIKDMFKNN
ncbi:MAG: CsbD family protein [Streptosporangiaceae bacterium]